MGADSLDTAELVMAFEEEFGSEISDSEAEKILTVGDAVKFVEEKPTNSINAHKKRWGNDNFILSSGAGNFTCRFII